MRLRSHPKTLETRMPRASPGFWVEQALYVLYTGHLDPNRFAQWGQAEGSAVAAPLRSRGLLLKENSEAGAKALFLLLSMAAG